MRREDIRLEAFWAKVNGLATDGCWEWQGCVNHWGYGMFQVRNGKKKMAKRAHRISFLLATGTLPEYVCHTCDNPRCVNPAHLFAGDGVTNARDMRSKGRDALTGMRAHSRALDDQTVLEMRKLYAEGQTNGELARRFGVSTTTVHCVTHRKTWTHV